MKSVLHKYVATYKSCQENKSKALSLVELLQPLPILDRIWVDITLDFIEGLSTSRGFNSILVMMD